MAQKKLRDLIWRVYRDLLAYLIDPSARRKAQLRLRFDRIFKRTTGFVSLDLTKTRSTHPGLSGIVPQGPGSFRLFPTAKENWSPPFFGATSNLLDFSGNFKHGSVSQKIGISRGEAPCSRAAFV